MAPVLSSEFGIFGSADAFCRIEGHSFDEPSQHLGRLHIAAQQIGRQRWLPANGRPRRQARGWSDVRLARQPQCKPAETSVIITSKVATRWRSAALVQLAQETIDLPRMAFAHCWVAQTSG
jgi:hypothetical protein